MEPLKEDESPPQILAYLTAAVFYESLRVSEIACHQSSPLDRVPIGPYRPTSPVV